MMKEVAGDDEGGPADNRLEVRDKSVTRRDSQEPRSLLFYILRKKIFLTSTSTQMVTIFDWHIKIFGRRFFGY